MFFAAAWPFGQAVRAQVVSTMPPAPATESFFLYEVKLVDEFIERFNNEADCYLRRQCREMYGTDSMITRPRMLRSLFHKGQPWGATVDSFVTDVLQHNYTIDFTDSNWYATIECIMRYKGKELVVPITLRIQTADGASQWKIAGVGAIPMPQGAVASVPPAARPAPFLPTSSHGTDFAVFHQVFTPRGISPAYFDDHALQGQGGSLYAAIHSGAMQFSYVRAMQFHFLNVPGWIFTVTHIARKDTNTGWLITALRPATPADKRAFAANLLY